MMSDLATTAFVHADYEEFKPETLMGFVVTICRADGAVVAEQRFLTLEDAMEYASQAEKIVHLASVDHYFYDLGRPQHAK
ncbi:hypothetical protein IFT59_07585 [Rhizobium sp. CFBP 8752]|uniref:hypothetical protein n=1 Tax=Rhizobium sp. CFBP 8752 TaxID=2775301 RepID=UPI00177D12D0|nr:hypothetical protein [Rhizobium sp. CFBP 8752]MBD8663113.1 hypothetical protein [Rhizobium sp. CFBP 8752]